MLLLHFDRLCGNRFGRICLHLNAYVSIHYFSILNFTKTEGRKNKLSLKLLLLIFVAYRDAPEEIPLKEA
jgi:hypothetical protein